MNGGDYMTNKKDLSGQKYNYLTFLYQDPDNNKKWICRCDCGNLKSVYPYNVKRGLTQSCGCLHSKIVSDKLTNDLTNQRFGKLVVQKRDLTKAKSKGVYWICKCDCGNETSVISHSLTDGTTNSCGCLKRELTSRNLSLKLEGEKFGKLTVIKRNGTFVSSNGTQYSQWLCKCECGTNKIIKGHDLIRGSVTSCGCTISRGEEEIRKILNELNINFKTQYGFNDLKSHKGWMLKFDFAVFDSNDNLLALIEYQGQQHYDDTYGWFGEQQRHETDKLKKDYCQKNNILLFEISYKDKIRPSLVKILSNLKAYMPIPCQVS